MKSKITKLTAAAVIIIAVLTGISHFSGSVGMTSAAWASLPERLEQIPTVKYRASTGSVVGDKVEIGITALVYQSSQCGCRRDTFMGEKLMMRSYLLPKQNLYLVTHPETKEYMRMEFSEEESLRIYRQLDPRECIKRIMSQDYKELGRAVIDRIEVIGVEVENPQILDFLGTASFESCLVRLWISVKTELPVRIEIEGSAAKGKVNHKTVLEEFQ